MNIHHEHSETKTESTIDSTEHEIQGEDQELYKKEEIECTRAEARMGKRSFNAINMLLRKG